MYETILYTIKDNVATITINRPEVSNAFSLTTYSEVKTALEQAGMDEMVRVIVITGTGKNFSAGGDVNRFKTLIETEEFLPPEGVIAAGAMTRAVKLCPKPVVAKINGVAAGAGCSLALASDFRVMDEKSKLAMAFINMSFSGDTGGIYFLNRIVGVAKTTEMLVLAEPVKGQEALTLGLTTELAAVGELDDVTAELVEKLRHKPTQAIAKQKALNYEFFFSDLEQFNEKEAQYMVECGRTADHKEAVYAFLEKRKPVFTGK